MEKNMKIENFKMNDEMHPVYAKHLEKLTKMIIDANKQRTTNNSDKNKLVAPYEALNPTWFINSSKIEDEINEISSILQNNDYLTAKLSMASNNSAKLFILNSNGYAIHTTGNPSFIILDSDQFPEDCFTLIGKMKYPKAKDYNFEATYATTSLIDYIHRNLNVKLSRKDTLSSMLFLYQNIGLNIESDHYGSLSSVFFQVKEHPSIIRESMDYISKIDLLNLVESLAENELLKNAVKINRCKELPTPGYYDLSILISSIPELLYEFYNQESEKPLQLKDFILSKRYMLLSTEYGNYHTFSSPYSYIGEIKLGFYSAETEFEIDESVRTDPNKQNSRLMSLELNHIDTINREWPKQLKPKCFVDFKESEIWELIVAKGFDRKGIKSIDISGFIPKSGIASRGFIHTKKSFEAMIYYHRVLNKTEPNQKKGRPVKQKNRKTAFSVGEMKEIKSGLIKSKSLVDIYLEYQTRNMYLTDISAITSIKGWTKQSLKDYLNKIKY